MTDQRNPLLVALRRMQSQARKAAIRPALGDEERRALDAAIDWQDPALAAPPPATPSPGVTDGVDR